jgi:hypothetical protein
MSWWRIKIRGHDPELLVGDADPSRSRHVQVAVDDDPNQNNSRENYGPRGNAARVFLRSFFEL